MEDPRSESSYGGGPDLTAVRVHEHDELLARGEEGSRDGADVRDVGGEGAGADGVEGGEARGGDGVAVGFEGGGEAGVGEGRVPGAVD